MRAPKAGGGLLAARLLGAHCPRSYLCHLTHHVGSNCPQELGVMMSEVRLCRLEELAPAASHEMRPTFAGGRPAGPFGDVGDVLDHCGGFPGDALDGVCRGWS